MPGERQQRGEEEEEEEEEEEAEEAAGQPAVCLGRRGIFGHHVPLVHPGCQEPGAQGGGKGLQHRGNLSRGAGSTGPRAPARSSTGSTYPGSPLGTKASAPPAWGEGRWVGLLPQGGVGHSLPQADWGAKRPPTTRGSPGAQRGTSPWQEPQQEWPQNRNMMSWGRLGMSTAMSVGGPRGHQPQSRHGSTGQAMREMGVVPTATMRGEVPRCTLRDGRHVLRPPWGQWRK